MKIGIFLLFLVFGVINFIFPVFAEEKSLVSSGFESSGLGYWKVTSKVVEVDAALFKNSNEAAVRDFLKTVGIMVSRGIKQKIYKYTYVLSNESEDRIKMNFSEWDLVHSPITRIIQDFSFELAPNSSKTVKFLANSPPHEIISPINIALWDKGNNKWIIIGAGKATFFIPERDDYYTEVNK